MGMVSTAPRLLQRGGGSFTGLERARPGRWSGVLLLLCPVCYCPRAVEVVPSHEAAVVSSRSTACLLSPAGLTSRCHGETAWMFRGCWRMFVGGELGGSQRFVRGVECRGSGEIPVEFDPDAVAPPGVTILLEGCRMYPFSAPRRVPGEILGSVRAAASSSSPPFLKVFLGTRQSGGMGVWWKSPERAQRLRLIFV